MLRMLARHWAAVMVRGFAALLFGITALVWPEITLLALTTLFGAYALVDGVIAVASAVSRRRAGGGRGWLAAEGAAAILVGVVTLFWPAATALALLWLIAGWALVTGVLRIATAVRLRREIHNEWLLVLSGVLSVVLAVVLVAWPASGALAVVFVLATYAIAAGLTLLGLAWRLRGIDHAHDTGDLRDPVSSSRRSGAA